MKKKRKKIKKKTTEKKKSNPLANIAKSALVTLPNERGFNFYTDFNRSTGVVARNLPEFISALKKVNLASIEFHTKRKDFSKWISKTLKDKALANYLARMSKLNGESLRKKILERVESRYKTLMKAVSH